MVNTENRLLRHSRCPDRTFERTCGALLRKETDVIN